MNAPAGKGSTLRRLLVLAEAIAAAPRSPADLAHDLAIPRPSVHRLVQQLVDDGFALVDARGQIVPGPRLYRLGGSLLRSDSALTQRRALLRALAEDLGETCGIALPDAGEMIYFDRAQAHWPVQLQLPIGSRVPSWCTSSGKLYLAMLPPARRRALIKQLPLRAQARQSITDPDALEQALARIAETGVGTDDEEFVDGMAACAVPIRFADGGLAACLFVHAVTARQRLDDLLVFVPRMRRTAEELAGVLLNEGNG